LLLRRLWLLLLWSLLQMRLRMRLRMMRMRLQMPSASMKKRVLRQMLR